MPLRLYTGGAAFYRLDGIDGRRSMVARLAAGAPLPRHYRHFRLGTIRRRMVVCGGDGDGRRNSKLRAFFMTAYRGRCA